MTRTASIRTSYIRSGIRRTILRANNEPQNNSTPILRPVTTMVGDKAPATPKAASLLAYSNKALAASVPRNEPPLRPYPVKIGTLNGPVESTRAVRNPTTGPAIANWYKRMRKCFRRDSRRQGVIARKNPARLISITAGGIAILRP